ncbi:MAG TPA: potassium-transporting ATPase subunit C [Kofleriaceae bacterium]|jgi:K+-transporting ATPase ATPase C chain
MWNDIKQTLRPALVSLALFTVLLGLVYPAAMIALAAVLPHPAPTDLVGQPFDDPAYIWGRTSAVSYNAMASGGTNAGPTGFIDDKGHLGPNKTLTDAVSARIAALHEVDPDNTAPVPVDLVTSSASGLDPDISPAAAYHQAARVAKLRGTTRENVVVIIDGVLEERFLGVIGERRVNVVRLNRALDAAFPRLK